MSKNYLVRRRGSFEAPCVVLLVSVLKSGHFAKNHSGLLFCGSPKSKDRSDEISPGAPLGVEKDGRFASPLSPLYTGPKGAPKTGLRL